MTRPLTCLTLICAAGAGLYLYQEKHSARMVDHAINQVVHATEQTRDRIGMMRAEWALLNEPDRLAGLAAQHLVLQTMTPGQFVQIADLGSHLPAVGAPTAPPAAIEPAAPAPVAAIPVAPGKFDPAKGGPALLAQAAPGMAAPGTAATATAIPTTVVPRVPHPMRVAAKPPEPVYHPVYAPVMQAFASQSPQLPIRPPSVQQAAAGLPPLSYAPPFTGSALGMARTSLAAPVPVASTSIQ